MKREHFFDNFSDNIFLLCTSGGAILKKCIICALPKKQSKGNVVYLIGLQKNGNRDVWIMLCGILACMLYRLDSHALNICFKFVQILFKSKFLMQLL